MLSRFWYFVIATVAAFALLIAFSTVGRVNRQAQKSVRKELVSHRTTMELTLKAEARRRMDSVAKLAANADLRRVLSKSRRAEKDVQTLERKLAGLNQQLGEAAGDLVYVLDTEGVIIGQIGGSRAPKGAGFRSFPVITRALAGYAGDDTWMLGTSGTQTAYRIAARPVIDGGAYVGVIVHASAIDEDFGRRLASRFGDAQVTFFRGEQAIASAGAEGTVAIDLAETGKLLSDDVEYQKGNASERKELSGAVLIASKMHGSAGRAGLSYAIAQTPKLVASPLELLSFDEIKDMDGLWFWSAILLSLLLAGFGVFFFFVESARPFARLEKAAAALAKGEAPAIPGQQFSGRMRKIVEDINGALSGGSSTTAELDDVIGQAKRGVDTGGGFFASIPPEAPEAVAPAPAQVEKDAFGLPIAASKDAAPMQPAPSPPSELPRSTGKSPDPGMSASLGGAMSIGSLPGATPQTAHHLSDEFQQDLPTGLAPQSHSQPTMEQKVVDFPDLRSPPRAPNAAPTPPSRPAPVPKAALPAPPAVQPRSSVGSDLEREHFQEVFGRFVETKRTCGEETTGLTFDKFSETLKRKQDVIASQHGVNRVHFDVYVKNGKAALRATPVRKGY